MRKSVAVAFSPRVGKKKEREIHWRYGLVSARVERTMCGKKQEKREKEKKEAISSRLFSAPPLRSPRIPEQETAWTFCASESFIIETVWVISNFNGAKRKLSPKYSRVRGRKDYFCYPEAQKYLLKK